MITVPTALPGSSFDEELARSELYGLLALLYYAPPSEELLEQLRAAVTEAPSAGAVLEESWRSVVGLAREMSPEEIQNEYNLLFGGIGKPEVYLYGSHYLSGFLNEKPLARLRTHLAQLGLARDDGMSETEDHLACLCEVMRYLIAGDEATDTTLVQQKDFFTAEVQTWVSQLCDAIQAHPRARFYAALAVLTRSFAEVEALGFEMLN